VSTPLFTGACRHGVRRANLPWWRWPDRLVGGWAAELWYNLVVDADGLVSLQGWGRFVGRTVPVGQAADLVVHARPKPNRVQLRTKVGDLWTFRFQGDAAADLLLQALARFHGPRAR
jgi:hypothetical protein